MIPNKKYIRKFNEKYFFIIDFYEHKKMYIYEYIKYEQARQAYIAPTYDAYTFFNLINEQRQEDFHYPESSMTRLYQKYGYGYE
jgi:hypothetical protein